MSEIEDRSVKLRHAKESLRTINGLILEQQAWLNDCRVDRMIRDQEAIIKQAADKIAAFKEKKAAAAKKLQLLEKRLEEARKAIMVLQPNSLHKQLATIKRRAEKAGMTVAEVLELADARRDAFRVGSNPVSAMLTAREQQTAETQTSQQ